MHWIKYVSLKRWGYDNLVISIKSSGCYDVPKHMADYRKKDHPLHVEYYRSGNSVFWKYQICRRTWNHSFTGESEIRFVFSLTGAPLEEIKSAKRILKTLGLRKGWRRSCFLVRHVDVHVFDLIGLAK